MDSRPPTLTQFLTRVLGQVGAEVPSWKAELPEDYDEQFAAWEAECEAWERRDEAAPAAPPSGMIDKGLLDMRSMLR